MLVVRVELHSALSGEITEVGCCVLGNDGTGTYTRGNYNVYAGRRGQLQAMSVLKKPMRKARVENHPRQSESVWSLVRKALVALEF